MFQAAKETVDPEQQKRLERLEAWKKSKQTIEADIKTIPDVPVDVFVSPRETNQGQDPLDAFMESLMKDEAAAKHEKEKEKQSGSSPKRHEV